MQDQISVWFYLLLVCLPALIIFAICYMVIKQFFQNRIQMESLELKKKTAADTLPLRLQAYERLVLFFERTDISLLISKLRTGKMSSGDLEAALMVTLQQEFEHNATQQIYVSDKLWEVVTLAKQEIMNQIHQIMIDVAFSEDVDVYSSALIEHFSKKSQNPAKTAIFAIKQEAKLHL